MWHGKLVWYHRGNIDIYDWYQSSCRGTERTALYSVLGIVVIVQMGITKKIYIQELCFLRPAYRLILVNISMTFHEDILNGFQDTELLSGRHCILFLALPFLFKGT